MANPLSLSVNVAKHTALIDTKQLRSTQCLTTGSWQTQSFQLREIDNEIMSCLGGRLTQLEAALAEQLARQR